MSIPALIGGAKKLLAEASSPTVLEQVQIIRLIRCTNRVLDELFGAESYIIGAAFSKVLIPNEFIESTQLLSSKDPKEWSLQASHALCQESIKVDPSLVVSYTDSNVSRIEFVQLCVNGNVVQCAQDKIRMEISVNNISGMLLTAALEVFNHIVGKDNLLKKSLILIKLWINFESKRFTFLDISELFRHDCLVVMVMMIFVTRNSFQQTEIDNPLAALICFLEIFSEFDWSSSYVTATSFGVAGDSSSSSSHYQLKTDGPSTFDSDYLFSSSSHSGKNTLKEELERIIDTYRGFYVENFVMEEMEHLPQQQQHQQHLSGREQMFGRSSDFDIDMQRESYSTTTDAFTSQHSLAHSHQNVQSSTISGCVVIVLDPFVGGRNLCGSCPAIFKRKYVSNQLREVFAKGLNELAHVVDPLLKATEDLNRAVEEKDLLSVQMDLLNTVFPMSYAAVRARSADTQEADMPASGITSNFCTLLQSLCHNLQHINQPDSLRMSQCSAIPRLEVGRNVMKSSEEGSWEFYTNALQSIEYVMFKSILIASKKVTEESILSLIIQILHLCGPMPIGEIGKQLQLMTRNPDFPKILKKRFGGLKKFISSHPDHFNCGDNHNFNPVVSVVQSDTHRTNKGGPAPAAPSGLSSIPSQKPPMQQQSAVAMLQTSMHEFPMDGIKNAVHHHSGSLTSSAATALSVPRHPMETSFHSVTQSNQFGKFNALPAHVAGGIGYGSGHYNLTSWSNLEDDYPKPPIRPQPQQQQRGDYLSTPIAIGQSQYLRTPQHHASEGQGHSSYPQPIGPTQTYPLSISGPPQLQQHQMTLTPEQQRALNLYK